MSLRQFHSAKAARPVVWNRIWPNTQYMKLKTLQVPAACMLLLTILAGCEFFKPKELSAEKAIARVENNYLYPSDLEGLLSPNVSKEDSVKLIEKYVEDWIKKQLMISRSAESMDYNEAEIERKVLDYRYALIVHNYEKQYIDDHLKKEVSPAAIKDYYQSKSDNFLLKQNIAKCFFVQVPKDAPRISQFRKNFRAYPDGNKDDLFAYISQFATKSVLEDTTWIIFDELTFGTPLESVNDRSQFLSRTKYSETSDDEYIYFLNIFDFKISGEISPLEFIRENIENIIINKRKIALKKELEENTYENAKKDNLFEIYRN